MIKLKLERNTIRFCTTPWIPSMNPQWVPVWRDSWRKAWSLPYLAVESRTIPVTFYARIITKPELRVEQETTAKLTLAEELGHSLTQVVKGWSSPPLTLLWPTNFNCGTLVEILDDSIAYKYRLQMTLSTSSPSHLEAACAYLRVSGLYSSRNLDSG